MQYDYERLTPDRFQELCQALIAKQHPTAKCFPVGQADGGRDVAVTEQLDGEPTSVVYQVKFRRSLQRSEDTYARIREAVRHERPKVQKLAARGATHYVLVTNLSGSSALDQGVRDRVDKLLRDELPIETQVWWREDIDARLNDSYDIKWSFSEIFTSSDLLRTLIEEGLGENASRRNMAIVSYMTSQYEQDEFVKFKQADLQASDLLALFIDVPASSQKATRETATRADMFAIRRILVATQEAGATGANALPRPDDLSVGGATLMLHPVGQSHFTSVVLEGGPGQGKSTLAQYVGQVHRMKLLGKTDRLTELPADHRLSPTRVPFKVDLRDFSSWLRRIDPFHADEDLPSLATQTLETFLAAQIEHLSGGQGFSVDDLRLYLSRVPALIILDGLDEVAAMVDRKDVIDSINAAHGRMTATAQSIQFLVTSRPAATAATPRFTDKRWQFVDLRPITEALIYGYAERWSAARRIPKRDIDEIKRILRSKLSSPHIKELSRNAMQLTILLQLIHSRGQALPDQRTELYDRYVDVLFNREADKNPVVLNNRQLLIDLHGFLAWKMHAGAQSRRSNGRISEEELQKLIGLYMTTKGHDPSAIDELFAGVVQRIVALVGRVEGTFEFEVQPLREYFAARHLYNTAPYSPTGSPQPGTKPEIFAAIAPQPYWLNVTRFFAGCYSMGELPGLADQLKQMLVEGDLALTSFPRVVATSLLTDRVFQQDPRVTSALAAATAVTGQVL